MSDDNSPRRDDEKRDDDKPVAADPVAAAFDPMGDMMAEAVANAPTEFPAARFKMGLIAAVDAAVIVLMISDMDSVEAAARPLVWLALAIFALMAVAFGREAMDPRPLLKLSAEGFEDRRHGFIPWSDVAYWQVKNGVLAKYFGYSLRKGANPPRAAFLYRAQGLMGAVSGRPQRYWPKQMLPSGLDAPTLGFRRFAADKEKR